MVLIFCMGIPVGCDTDSSEQRCTPQTQSGCRRGETCTVDVEGTPLCMPNNAGAAPEGASCLAPNAPSESTPHDPALRCAPGLGCISYLGVSRCLRFCDPELTGASDGCRSANASDDLAHPLSEFGQCGVTLYDRPEIGACVIPCRFGKDAESTCPLDTQCSLGLGSTLATCRPLGTGTVGDSCGGQCTCGPDLQCVATTHGGVCREKMDEGGQCAEGEDAYAILGSVDPISPIEDTPYRICSGCRDLGIQGLSYCTSPAACTTDHGVLASFDGAGGDVFAAVNSQNEMISAIGVGAILNADMVWVWQDSSAPIEPSYWADGEPQGDAMCIVLGSDGKLRGSLACESAVLCRTDRRPSCERGSTPD